MATKQVNEEEEKAKIITQIDREVLKKISGNVLNLNSTSLDFQSDQFKLESLDGLKKDPLLLQMHKLQSINLSSNALANIDILTNFKSLQSINASYNSILAVSLSLDSLTELDLSYNKISQIPPLVRLPRLMKLFLQYNVISNVMGQLNVLQNSLSTCDLSYNKIVFETGFQLQRFIDNMKKMNWLKIINLDKNPFMEQYPRTKDYLIRELCPQIEQLNGTVVPAQTIKELKAENNFPRISDLTGLIQGNNIQSDDTNQKKQVYLSDFNNLIDKCETNPIQIMQTISELSDLVNKVIQDPESWDKIFSSKDSETQMKNDEKIDDFLQSCQALCEHHESLQKPLIDVLANLSVIQQANFGTKCIHILEDLMASNNHFNKLVFKVLKEIIVPKLNVERVDKVPLSILKGIVRIMQNNEDNDFFTSSTFQSMLFWVKDILKFNQNKQPFSIETHELHDYCLILIAQVMKDPVNRQEMKQFKISSDISDLFKIFMNSEYSQRYCYLMEILELYCRYDKPSASEILNQRELPTSLYKDIQEQIKINQNTMKQNGMTLKDKASMDSDELVNIKYAKYSRCYYFLGSLSLYYPFVYSELTSDSFIAFIFQISNLFKCDPILLTSVCQFILDLLQNERIVKDSNMTSWILGKMQHMSALLPYLGGKKYSVICELSESYQKNTFFDNRAVELHMLTNKAVHKLFIQIVKLIKYIAENSGEVCQESCSIQNTFGRKQNLFNCMKIPSDDLNSAVNETMLSIDVEDWQTDEIQQLTKQISTYKNISAGKTEYTIATIFMILSNIIKTDTKTSIDFITLFAEQTILDCFDLFMRNADRDCKDFEEEDNEKQDLSLALIFFLKTSSQITSLRQYFRGKVMMKHFKDIIQKEITNKMKVFYQLILKKHGLVVNWSEF